MAGFCDIVGHEQIITHLKNAILMDKVSHAYILNGPEHAGKRLLAEAFAMTLQCETVQRLFPGEEQAPWQGARQGLRQESRKEPWQGLRQEPRQEMLFGLPADDEFGVSDEAKARARRMEPCLECHSCKQAMGHNQPDIIYVTHEKKAIAVDDVRYQINQDIAVKPYSSKYKVYIVDEAEKMNVQAMNALLKTLEEPPAYAVILLLTVNADAFLPTIRSRCVMLNLKAVKDELIRDFLMRKCQTPDYQADLCIAFAQGNVGQAEILASSEEFHELKDYTVQLVRRIFDIPVYDLMQELAPLGEYKEKIQVFFDLFLLLFRDVLLYKATGQEDRLVFGEQAFVIRQTAGKMSYEKLNHVFGEIETARRRIQANVNFELTLEMLLLAVKNETFAGDSQEKYFVPELSQ